MSPTQMDTTNMTTGGHQQQPPVHHHPMMMSSSSTYPLPQVGSGVGHGSSAGQQQQQQPRVDPTDVGCQFVQQYYTILNQDPKRLHCFYKKNSSFTCGVEGDMGVSTAIGQTEIHNRIMGLEFMDCKVNIGNLDCQGSLMGGIVILVNGQFLNRNMPAKKFSQTFFLAEQPNGYYVLNDILRFQKESSTTTAVESVSHRKDVPSKEESVVSGRDDILTASSSSLSKESGVPASTTSFDMKREPSSTVAATTTTVVGGSTRSDDTAKPQVKSMPSTKPSGKETTTATSGGGDASSLASTKPKTWATLAAVGKEQWGDNVSQVTGTSVVAEPSSMKQSHDVSSRTEKRSITTTATTTATDKPMRSQDMNIASSIFVKNVISTLSEESLRNAFCQFGQVKTIISLSAKNSAFIEFVDSQAAKKAINSKTLKVEGHDLSIEAKQPPRQSSSTATGNRRGPPPSSDVSSGSRRGERREKPTGSSPGTTTTSTTTTTTSQPKSSKKPVN